MAERFKNPISGKKKLLIRFIFIPLLLISGLFSGTIIFSPYGYEKGYNYKVIKTEIEINAAPDSIFRYLGNSDNASKWSVFVAEIIPLNVNVVPDGKVGCRRRCYGREDKNLQWDELTTIVEKNKRRQLVIYNMQNFPMIASGLATEQNYFPLGKNKTKLVFTVFYKDQPKTWETIKTYIAGFKIKSVFEKNLKNIKTSCEGGNPDFNF